MPKILNPRLYNSIYRVAAPIFTNLPDASKGYETVLRSGEMTYRYVGYRSGRPQMEDSGRKIWSPITWDTTNRWTGNDGNGHGEQGLYLSGDAPGGANTSFPELEHYQDASVPPNEKVSYFEYVPGGSPVWKVGKASELRSMFMFTVNQDLKGIDISYNDDPNNPINLVFEEAVATDPDSIPPGETARSLYMSPTDASFTRALGNAALSTGLYEFLKATSVRDGASVNYVVGAVTGETVASLTPEGRSTFFIDGLTRTSTGVFTIDDLAYNNLFDTDGGGGVIPTREELFPDYEPFLQAAQGVNDAVQWTYAETEVTSFINEQVSKALQGMDDPFSKTVDQIVAEIANPALDGAVRIMLTDYVVASGPLYDDFDQLTDTLSPEGVRSLLSAEVVNPVFNQMTDTSGGASYIELCVRQAVLAEQSHYLDQHASEIEAQIAKADAVSTETSQELEAQQAALDEVNRQLENEPDNAQLLDQQAQLEKEIKELDAAQEKSEQDKAEAEEEKQKSEAESKANQEDTEKTNEAVDAAGQEIFHGV